MDDDLDVAIAGAVRAHLATCVGCALVCEDFVSILDICSESSSSSDLAPPNSQAMWCRINNILENESKASPQAAVEQSKGRSWRFSFSQLATAMLCIAVVSSLLTVVAIQNYTQPTAVDFTTRSAETQTTFEKLLSRVGLVETPQQSRDRRLKEQNAAIEYWNARVQSRRLQWDRMTRDAFDRNLQVIDESVSEYTMILEQNPDDDLSGEMLDSVLSEKMNLLRDFSDL